LISRCDGEREKERDVVERYERIDGRYHLLITLSPWGTQHQVFQEGKRAVKKKTEPNPEDLNSMAENLDGEGSRTPLPDHKSRTLSINGECDQRELV
jgi:hypothetical protein